MKMFSKANTKSLRRLRACAHGLVLGAFSHGTMHAGILQADDGETNDKFALSSALGGNTALAGAYFHDTDGDRNRGAAYVFGNIQAADGIVTQSAKLTASDGARSDFFGFSVALSGTSALVGARGDFVGQNNAQGSAYFFRNIETANGTVTEDSKLTASDGAGLDFFGNAVALRGDTAIVGASPSMVGTNINQGSAYLFRNLGSAPANITQNAKLIASDGAPGDQFGNDITLSDNIALVAASSDDVGSNTDQGTVYLFRQLDSASGTVTEEARLTASDVAVRDRFGSSVALDGNRAIVGSFYHDIGFNSDQGSAYLFRELDTAAGTTEAPGTITEHAKLTASDGEASDNFGQAVSLSGNSAVVGAFLDNVGANSDQGSAYLFTGLGADASGVHTEQVKITASEGASFDYFGASVGIDGDRFVIGAYGAEGLEAITGKAFSGTVSSITVLDAGNAARVVSGLSFVSRVDWVVGKTTDGNRVVLSAGDAADVTGTGRGVFVGKEAGSDGNTLEIAGRLVASSVRIGAETGTVGNKLLLRGTADISGVEEIWIGEGAGLEIEGDLSANGALMSFLGGTKLHVWDGAAYREVTTGMNGGELLAGVFADGVTRFEPALRAPEVMASGMDTNGNFFITVMAPEGTELQLQRKDDLEPGMWEDIGSAVISGGGAETLTDMETTVPAEGFPKRFYRVMGRVYFPPAD